MNGEWQQVSESSPCPACGKPDWCAWAPSGILKCERSTSAPLGFDLVRRKDSGALFRRLVAPRASASEKHQTPRETARSPAVAPLNFTDHGIRDADNVLRAIHRRFDHDDGSKRFAWLLPSGIPSRNGEIQPARLPLFGSERLRAHPDARVVITEGEKAAIELLQRGVLALGTVTGASRIPEREVLAPLAGRTVLLWPDNDDPGRKHMERIACSLKENGAADVRLVDWRDAPPKGDAADFLMRQSEPIALDELLAAAAPWRPTSDAKREALTQSEALVRLGLAAWRIGQDTEGNAFAVSKGGPNVALPVRSKAFRAALARDYRRTEERTPSETALREALSVLEGEALEAPREPVHLRVAEHETGIVVDLGCPNGQAVAVTAAGWTMLPRSPVPFRRTVLTLALPEPKSGGSLEDLRTLLNVTDETWPLVIGWLVAALLPNRPRPILMLGGRAGAGKTTFAKILAGLVDPSAVPVQAEPRDVERWAIAAAGSQVVVIDNVSTLTRWWSDALCRAVTGDGLVRRALYTDCDLSVLTLRRALVLTSIDPGALREDLGERILLVDLEPIRPDRRQSERALLERFADLRPELLGALLDVTSAVLRELPRIQERDLPRMADFARVLLALDRVRGTRTAEAYIGQEQRVAEDVLEGDDVGRAICELLSDKDSWPGTAADLLSAIEPQRPDRARGWPANPRALTARLKRIEPALERVGIIIERARQPGGSRTRTLILRRQDRASTVPTVPTAPSLDATGSAATRCDDVQDAASVPKRDASRDGRPSVDAGSFRDGRERTVAATRAALQDDAPGSRPNVRDGRDGSEPLAVRDAAERWEDVT